MEKTRRSDKQALIEQGQKTKAVEQKLAELQEKYLKESSSKKKFDQDLKMEIEKRNRLQ